MRRHGAATCRQRPGRVSSGGRHSINKEVSMPSDIRRVVTGLDASNKAIVQFDNRVPLAAGPHGIASVNLWITESYPPALLFDQDPSKKPIGISPPENGTKFRVVEFPPLDQ